MTPSPQTKKRKAPVVSATIVKKATTISSNGSATKSVTTTAPPVAILSERAALHQAIGYEPLTLKDIHDRINGLCRRVPPIPADGFALQNVEANGDDRSNTKAPSTVPVAVSVCPYNQEAVKEWAAALQSVLEEFHLLISVVSAATYRWGTDRSGAADQNLTLLCSELHRSQEQILGRVTPRLNDVLAPVVSLLTDKTVVTKLPDGTETKQNYFITALEDPEYVVQCYVVLARNAAFLRHVVLANFDKLLSAVADYLEATQKDSQHDARGFVY